jgi:hypothetical protein
MLLNSICMAHNLIQQGYIPLDKSWINRMALLDFINGRDYSIQFLREQYDELGDDLKATYRAYTELKQGKKEINVGESGTLYRFLKFFSYKHKLDLVLIPEGTLVDRVKNFCDDPDMVNWSLEKLLNTEDRTTQWASAAILCGNEERIENPHPKIRVTYDAFDHWHGKIGLPWKKQHDMTIMGQALAYLNILEGKTVNYVPQDAEDYCFSRAFGFMTKEEGKSRYPTLRGHESDRIVEMEKQLSNLSSRKLVDSNDHRVVQAISMMYVTKRKAHIKKAVELGMTSEEIIRRIQSKFSNPNCVSKSWPQFWKFMKYSVELL